MSRIHVFTSAAGNYLPKVQVLFDSLATHHPDWQRHLLLVEDWSDDAVSNLNLNASIAQPKDLNIPDWRPWAFCHSIVELCTAVKPFMLKQLLAREDCDAVIYLDPDIRVFSVLQEVTTALSEHSVLLTPHQCAPETTLAGVMSNEFTSLRYGTYNLGFIGVSSCPSGHQFAQWWAQRAYRFNRDDVSNGLFTDQRWMDLVPSLFDEVALLRQRRFNVASWNAHQRDLTMTPDGDVQVAGEPLGFYHFTGLDSGNHDLALTQTGNAGGVEGELVQNYREALAVYARQFDSNQWSFAHFADGAAVDNAWRRAYRDNATLQARFPDPWCSSGIASTLQAVAEETVPAHYVSPGYVAGEAGSVDANRLTEQLAHAVRRPSSWMAILSAMKRILGREGWRGLRRRISRSGGERM